MSGGEKGKLLQREIVITLPIDPLTMIEPLKLRESLHTPNTYWRLLILIHQQPINMNRFHITLKEQKGTGMAAHQIIMIHAQNGTKANTMITKILTPLSNQSHKFIHTRTQPLIKSHTRISTKQGSLIILLKNPHIMITVTPIIGIPTFLPHDT